MAGETFDIPVGADTSTFDRDIEKAVKNATKNNVKVNVIPKVSGGEDSRVRSAAQSVAKSSTQYSNSISSILSDAGSGRILGIYQSAVSGLQKAGGKIYEKGKGLYDYVKGLNVGSGKSTGSSIPTPASSSNTFSNEQVADSITKATESIRQSASGIPSGATSGASRPSSAIASFQGGSGGSSSGGIGSIKAQNVDIKARTVNVYGKINSQGGKGGTLSTGTPSIPGFGSNTKGNVVSEITNAIQESGNRTGRGWANTPRDSRGRWTSEKPGSSMNFGSALKNNMQGGNIAGQAIISTIDKLAEVGGEIGESIAESIGGTVGAVGTLADAAPMPPQAKLGSKIVGWLGKAMATVGPMIGSFFGATAKAAGAIVLAGLGAVGAAVGIASYLGGKYREQITKQDSTIGATGRWVSGGGSLFRNEQVAEANLSLGRQTGENVFGRGAMTSGEEMRFAASLGVPLSSLAEVLGSMRKDGNKPMALAQMRGFANALGYTNLRQMEFLQLLSQQISKEKEEGVKNATGKEFLKIMMGLKGTQALRQSTAGSLSEMGKQGFKSSSAFEMVMFGEAMGKYGSISEAELKLQDPESRLEILTKSLETLGIGSNLKRGTNEFDSAYTIARSVMGDTMTPNQIQSLLTGDINNSGLVKPQTGSKVGSVPGAALSNREEGLYLNATGKQAFELAMKIESGLMNQISKHSDAFGTVLSGLDKSVDLVFSAIKGMEDLAQRVKEEEKQSAERDAILSKETAERDAILAQQTADRDQSLNSIMEKTGHDLLGAIDAMFVRHSIFKKHMEAEMEKIKANSTSDASGEFTFSESTEERDAKARAWSRTKDDTQAYSLSGGPISRLKKILYSLIEALDSVAKHVSF